MTPHVPITPAEIIEDVHRAVEIGIVSGGGVRVGLEDNIWFDADRTRLASNSELLRRIHEIALTAGRKPMQPATLRKELLLAGKAGSYGRNRTSADLHPAQAVPHPQPVKTAAVLSSARRQ